jgi:uncharacterized lipoprotein NlpE involved in copper resistance
MMMKTLILTLGITLFGCGKKADDKAADKPAAGAAFTSDDEYVTKGKEVVNKLIDAFKSGGQDCDKIAADVSKLVDDPVVHASKAYEKAHPDAKKKFDKEAKEIEKQFEAAATPAMTACANNKAFTDAFAKME